jgi:uncharacterized protein DUF222
MDGSAVRAALSSIRVAIDDLNELVLSGRTHAEALDDTRDCFSVLQSLEAVYLAIVADLEGRALPEGLTAKAFLRSVLRRTRGQAAGDVRAALNRLPRSGEAFSAGEISREHLDVIVKTVERIPDEVRFREIPPLPELESDDGEAVTVIDAVDAFFARRARQYDSYQLRALAKALLAALMPNADDGFDPLAYERRQESHARDENGMVCGTFALDAANGADFAAAVDHFSAPVPKRTETAEDGAAVDVFDTRSPAQRRADALGLIARLAMGAAAAGTKGGEPPRVVLYTGIDDYHDVHCTDSAHTDRKAAAVQPDSEQPEPEPPTRERVVRGRRLRGRVHGATDTQLGAIGPELLARFSCDAVLQVALMRPTGAILDLGRDARTISAAQRRALTARDRGCVIPGCTAPAGWCDAHHVTFWRHGGRTNLDELALVCGQHHTAVHLGLWELRMFDGVPWARPPGYIDPQRRWVRNTFHRDLDAARDLGDQMRDEPPKAA